MDIDGWRERLIKSLENSGRSMRSVSLAAGKGPGYIHSILSEGKEPTIDSLSRVCQEINVSLSYIIYGYNITSEQEEFITLFSKASPPERKAILMLLRSRTPEADLSQIDAP
ncbi:helix-turn-helix domain-containing protein [Bartonella sp. DGB2]|uniref:helix-turn-helix domain-containing protein n=1 Tax=Bartonella sp. DGB2 TaxID=3388426 RepID=UPI00398FACFF